MLTLRCSDVGRLDAVGAPVLAVARQARLRRRDRALRAGHVGAGTSARPAPATAPSASPARLAEAHAAGARRRRTPAQAAERHEAAGRCRRQPIAAACWRRARRRPRHQRVKAFVDFQNDVTAKDISLAVREGLRSIEHVKRYTTTGMATDQGKTSNMNAPGDRRRRRSDKPIPQVGLTTFRPPYTPVTFGALRRPCARRAVRPDPHARRSTTGPRRTAPCSRMSASGSAPGTSRRPARTCTPPSPANAARCARRRRPVRRLDARQDRGRRPGRGRVPEPHLHQRLDEARARPLPLRPDAATRTASSMDDGVVGRLAPDRFHVTTTTGGAPRVLAPHGGLSPDRVPAISRSG